MNRQIKQYRATPYLKPFLDNWAKEHGEKSSNQFCMSLFECGEATVSKMLNCQYNMKPAHAKLIALTTGMTDEQFREFFERT